MAHVLTLTLPKSQVARPRQIQHSFLTPVSPPAQQMVMEFEAHERSD